MSNRKLNTTEKIMFTAIFMGFMGLGTAFVWTFHEVGSLRFPWEKSSENLPPHTVASRVSLGGNGERIQINSLDPQLSKSDCEKLANHYKPQAGQISIHKPSSMLKRLNPTATEDQLMQPFCVNNLDGRDVFFNDYFFEAKKLAEVSSTNETQIVCNKFKLITKIKGSTLDFSIDTDLPDNTLVIVRVSRSYLEKGNPETYSADYFLETSTIGKWKSKQSISIASEKWKMALKVKQQEMSKIGLGFDVASISNKIEVRMVVPINQPDPKFGNQNQNLTGKAVKTKDIRVIEDEIEINKPL